MMLVMGMFWNHNNFPPPMREGGGEVSGDAHVGNFRPGPATLSWLYPYGP